MAHRERRVLASLAWWLVLLLPGLLALLLLSMTTRGAGFASRGRAGSLLERIGQMADGGTRAVNGLLPGGLHQPGIPDDRPR